MLRPHLVYLSVLSLAAGAALVACGDDADATSDTSATTSANGGAPGGSGGTPLGAGGNGGMTGCPSGTTCFDAVPMGWTGPVIRYQGSSDAELPSCPDMAPDVALDAFADLQPASAPTCDCSCGEPTGASCDTGSAGQVSFTPNNGASCGGTFCGSDTLDAGECIPAIQGSCASQPNMSQSVGTNPADVSGASCPPTQDMTPGSEPEWGEAVRLCEVDDAGACEDGTCAALPPAPFAEQLCIAREGDHACPGATYTERTVAYSSVDDTRDCSTCTCGTPSGVACEGTMDAYSSVVCNSGLIGSWSVPGCVPWPPTGGTFYIQFDLDPTGGSCAPSGGMPTGDVTPAAATTICCTP
jgi:hypothetical protein